MNKTQNTEHITDIVRQGYSHKEVVEEYAKARDIWPEEKFIFDKFFKNIGHVLDIGCGGGRTSFCLASLRNKVTAIDLSPHLITAAKERLIKEPANIEFFVKDAQCLDYPDNYFDGIIFSYNGIDFIPKKEGKIKFLKEVRRILKPNTYFFFTAHNFWQIDRYLPRNILQVIKISFSKLFHLNILEKEYGEKHDKRPNVEAPYIDIKGKKTWNNIIKLSVFKVEYFNSRYGIRDKRPFSVFKDYFGKGNYLFFVLRK